MCRRPVTTVEGCENRGSAFWWTVRGGLTIIRRARLPGNGRRVDITIRYGVNYPKLVLSRLRSHPESFREEATYQLIGLPPQRIITIVSSPSLAGEFRL